MRILQVASEVQPFSKTGGLADMVGALSRALARKGHQVDIVTPAYRGVLARASGAKPANWRFSIPLGGSWEHGEFYRLEIESGLTIWFVDHAPFFDRPGIYNERQVDYADNAARFIFFTKAASLLARFLEPIPAMVHCHDWQAGLLPLLIHHAKVTRPWPEAPATLMTIHNLAYQGWFPASQWALTNIPVSWFHRDSAEARGQMNLLKAGLMLSDALTTVSPRYAREISTPAFGCGLESILLRREYELTGILNGVDYEEWSTTNNPYLPHSYSVDSLEGKAANKRELQAQLGLSDAADIPLFANISRLTDQKGVDFQLEALRMLLHEGAAFQFVLLGSGDPALEQAYRQFAAENPHAVAVRIGFDAALAQRIEAGSDFYLMPSRFEPCGLNQLYSLRYGTVPVVRATGGLDDSVMDILENRDLATGIKFEEASARALAHAIRKALAVYRERPLLDHLRRNGMKADFSWDRQANEYATLYDHLLHEI